MAGVLRSLDALGIGGFIPERKGTYPAFNGLRIPGLYEDWLQVSRAMKRSQKR